MVRGNRTEIFEIAGRMDGRVRYTEGLRGRRDPQENRLGVSLTGDLGLAARIEQPAVIVRSKLVLKDRQVIV